MGTRTFAAFCISLRWLMTTTCKFLERRASMLAIIAVFFSSRAASISSITKSEHGLHMLQETRRERLRRVCCPPERSLVSSFHGPQAPVASQDRTLSRSSRSLRPSTGWHSCSMTTCFEGTSSVNMVDNDADILRKASSRAAEDRSSASLIPASRTSIVSQMVLRFFSKAASSSRRLALRSTPAKIERSSRGPASRSTLRWLSLRVQRPRT
mmetsp:Transcript_6448/g.17529  ORF Transcript_6448/g.17529 Transcript_6448/m.17529 type:complete len:211 (-) Transcript_6448:857-1489(-)